MLSGRQLQRIERDLVDELLEALVRQPDARAPEDLPVIIPLIERVRIVRRDFPRARRDGERHLHHLVEIRLVAGGAERAGVVLAVHRFQRLRSVEHAAAAGAEHVPRELEQSQPRRMQEGRDHALLIEPAGGRKVEHVEPAQRRVRGLVDEPFDRRRRRRIRRLPQHREQRPRLAHAGIIAGASREAKRMTARARMTARHRLSIVMAGLVPAIRFTVGVMPREGAASGKHRFSNDSLPPAMTGSRAFARDDGGEAARDKCRRSPHSAAARGLRRCGNLSVSSEPK